MTSLSKEQRGYLTYLLSNSVPSFLGGKLPVGILSTLTQDGTLEDKLLQVMSSPELSNFLNTEEEDVVNQPKDSKAVTECPVCNSLYVLDLGKLN